MYQAGASPKAETRPIIVTVVKPGIRTAEKVTIEGDAPARHLAADTGPERRLGAWNLKLGKGARRGR